MATMASRLTRFPWLEGNFVFQFRRMALLRADSNGVKNMACRFGDCGAPGRALRFFLGFGDAVLNAPRSTPTCARFEAMIEMPCIKRAEPMRLTLIEPRRRALDLLTDHCASGDSGESFLTAR